MDEPTPFQQAFQATFSIFRGPDAKPSIEEQIAYGRAADFHGFLGSEESEARFDPTFFVAMSWALIRHGRTYVFIPKVRQKWAFSRAEALCQEVRRRYPDKRQLVQDGLRCLHSETPPWGVTVEPPQWVAFGFEEDPVLLPEWCLGKLQAHA